MAPLISAGLFVVAALFVVATAVSLYAVLLVVVLAQLAFLWAWSRSPTPASEGNALLAAGGCLAADGVALLVAGSVNADEHAAAWTAGVCGVGVVLAFAVQLVRRDGRDHLVVSLAEGVAGLLLAVAGAGWLRVADQLGEPTVRAVCCVLLGLTIGGFVMAVPTGQPGARAAGALVAGACTGVLVALVGGMELPLAVAAGLVGACCAVAGHALVPTSQDRSAVVAAGSTVPVLLAGPLLWGLLRLSGS